MGSRKIIKFKLNEFQFEYHFEQWNISEWMVKIDHGERKILFKFD